MNQSQTAKAVWSENSKVTSSLLYSQSVGIDEVYEDFSDGADNCNDTTSSADNVFSNEDMYDNVDSTPMESSNSIDDTVEVEFSDCE